MALTQPGIIRTSDRNYFKPPLGAKTVRVIDRGLLRDTPLVVQTPDGVIYKRCCVCTAYKTLDEFNKTQNSLDGHAGYCKPCARERAITQYRQDPDAYKRRALAWQQAHPEYVEEYQMRGNGRRIRANINTRRDAQKRSTSGVDNDIDRVVVFQRDKGICGICGKPIDTDRWDLDHIVPLRKGGTHTYDNVRVTHPSCNRRREWGPR